MDDLNSRGLTKDQQSIIDNIMLDFDCYNASDVEGVKIVCNHRVASLFLYPLEIDNLDLGEILQSTKKPQN